MASAPIDGAAFTEMTSEAIRDPWCASDDLIAEAERIQYSLGEGPTQDAFRTRRPVLVPDLAEARAAARWPVFVAEADHLEIGGLFAIPMQIGAITGGVCTAYRRRAGLLSVADLRRLLRAVDVATLGFLGLRSSSRTYDDSSSLVADSTMARQVHQATGMLVAQLNVTAEEAFARLRAHAYSEGRTIHEIADQIVARHLRLEE